MADITSEDPARSRDAAAGDAAQTDDLSELFSTPIEWRRWWLQVPELVLVVCSAGLPVLITVNVIGRYTNWYQAPWANDVIHVVFLWIVFLGGAVAVKYEAHVRMSTFVDRFAGHGPLGRAWHLAVRGAPLVMGAILLVLGIRIVQLDMLNRLPWLQIPLGYFAVVIPVSGGLMIVYSALIFRRAVTAHPSRGDRR